MRGLVFLFPFYSQTVSTLINNLLNDIVSASRQLSNCQRSQNYFLNVSKTVLSTSKKKKKIMGIGNFWVTDENWITFLHEEFAMLLVWGLHCVSVLFFLFFVHIRARIDEIMIHIKLHRSFLFLSEVCFVSYNLYSIHLEWFT